MALFELVIALLLGGAVLSAWARRISIPYPPRARRNRPGRNLKRMAAARPSAYVRPP